MKYLKTICFLFSAGGQMTEPEQNIHEEMSEIQKKKHLTRIL